MITGARHFALLSPILLVLAGGCATKALWDNGRLDALKEPADKLNLRLFEATTQSNFLVVYNEYSERSGAVHTRAFWLKENQNLLAQGRTPRFTRPDATGNLTPVPVYYDPIPAGTTLPAGLCAVVATNKQTFTFFHAGRALASHDLPIYDDGKGKAERIALTPIAVTADLTVVGGVLGYVYLESLSENPVLWPWR
jgi:hypothetical protein